MTWRHTAGGARGSRAARPVAPTAPATPTAGPTDPTRPSPAVRCGNLELAGRERARRWSRPSVLRFGFRTGSVVWNPNRSRAMKEPCAHRAPHGTLRSTRGRAPGVDDARRCGTHRAVSYLRQEPGDGRGDAHLGPLRAQPATLDRPAHARDRDRPHVRPVRM